ncbi:patatin-like phospholipase family protein [Elizabethkingia anophelis]
MKKICILSLDGGGIRGIISCIILRYMEEQLQKQDNSQNKLGDYFDLVAGSSTGGLITSIMLYPDENRNARYSIQKAWNCIRKKEKISFRFLFLNG